MKIRKIKYNNHPVLNNLELDLVNPNTGSPYDTVVFAGENGTGKTSILSSLNTFLCLGSFSSFEYIEYEVNGNIFTARKPKKAGDSQYGYYERFDHQDNSITQIISSLNINRSTIDNDNFDIRHYGSVYSKARADYKANPIKGTTSLEMDKEIYDKDEQEDFTRLKQLVVDLESDDNGDLKELHENNIRQQIDYEAFRHSSRMFRFRTAFDNFFEKIKYKKVASQNGQKSVLFEKNNKTVEIDNLSTGEKQIVYRGIYLLRNVGKLDGAAVMVDEPELSMHPKWQKRILKYFKDLFTDDQNKQKVQLFFATHSEYVLGEALKDQTNTLVVVLNDNNGTIEKREIKTPLVLPTITASEINYAAFDVPSIDYHIALYGAIQSKYNKHNITACDQFIQTQCAPYYVQATHGVVTNYGGNTYNTLPTKIRNHIDHPDNPYTFTDDELKTSIVLMRDILENNP